MYNFQNKAIRCDTWQQMEQLAEIAERQGLPVQDMDKDMFHKAKFFGISLTKVPYYSHFTYVEPNETEISFDDFISKPVPTTAEYLSFRTSVLTHLPTGDIQAFAASPDGEKILAELYLPFEYSQDDLRVVAERVMEAFEAQ